MNIARGPEDFWIGVFYIVIAVLLLLIIFLLIRVLQKSMNGLNNLVNSEATSYLRIDENRIYREANSDEDFRSMSECSFAMLYKAYETKTHFFLFISNMQPHVVPKKDIIKGTPEELASVLSAKLGKKFKDLNIRRDVSPSLRKHR
jgi:hypothetical protein